MSEVVEQHAGAVHRHDLARLLRWLFIAGIVVAIVLVGMDNRNDVRVGYSVGEAKAPIWTVIAASAVAGLVIGWLVQHRPRRRV